MPEPITTHHQLAADFLTLKVIGLWGEFWVPSAGVLGMLNDPNSSYIEVMDAKLARIHMPTKLVGEHKLIDLVKTNLFAVCLARREDAGPQTQARGGYQNLTSYAVRVTSQVYELEGTLEWSGRFDFGSIMVEGVRDFVPMFDAVLSATLIPQLRIESPAILFNRHQVDTLALAATKTKPGQSLDQ